MAWNLGQKAKELKELASGALSRVTNKALLASICQASLLVAAADGSIDRAEIEQLQVTLAGNERLKAFSPAEINAVIAGYTDGLQNSFRSTKLRIKQDLLKQAANRGDAELVFTVALEVADKGGISEKERAVLVEIAGWLGLPAEID